MLYYRAYDPSYLVQCDTTFIHRDISALALAKVPQAVKVV
jgi:hypothetical protein